MGSRAERGNKALAAMRAMGFPNKRTKPILKRLLLTCENNWEHIEAENYSLLTDAILGSDETEKDPKEKQSSETVDSKKRDASEDEEPGLHRKRRQLEEHQPLAVVRSEGMPQSEGVQPLVRFKEPKVEPGLDSALGPAVPMNEVPPSGNLESQCRKAFPMANAVALKVTSSLENQNANRENGKASLSFVRNKRGTTDEVAAVVESSTNVEITSSTVGEAKVSILYNVVDCPDFRMPSLQSVLKRVEDRCLRSYKILDPSFSIMNVMKEVCKSVLELGTESVEDREEDPIRIVPSVDALKLSRNGKLLGGAYSCPPSNSTVSQLPRYRGPMAVDGLACNEQPSHNKKVSEDVGDSINEKIPEPSSSLVLVHQHEPALGAVRPIHDANDITKGEERIRVSIMNEFTSEQFPPHFSYIPHNIVFQNAYMNFSLARIGDEDYCSDCFGDCLSASIPCACARETSGEFAYSLDGLLKKEFLDDCISMNHNPQKDRMFYCKDCPLERSKNDWKPDACKGHLVRKFIKECWSKCGCNKQCGNRVVQRGITCNLQVFFSSEGKGWGLRTLDELPRGAFVCEYVGEVLTNTELYDRTIRTTGNARHTYPVLLDADWGSEGMLKDEEALCLDATFYGNVARFINHRCNDANLMEIPVEVETPDHHYYHLAFFTSRKVEAFEELTWDYGIDFDDHDHPIKAFRCLCGSKFCRDMKRRGRRKSGASSIK